jgi:hypothetical protein
MSTNDKSSPLSFAKKGNSKKGETWSETAKKRFIKQHGSIDEIPEGDAHAVPKYDDPTYSPPPSVEESKAAMDSLEEKLKELKEKGKTPVPDQPKGKNFYDEWID